MKSILLLSIAVAVQAANQIVEVAPTGSFTFSPNSVTAAVGDTIEFQFESNVSPLWHNLFAEPLCRSSGILESMSADGWRYSPRCTSVDVKEFGPVLSLQPGLNRPHLPRHKGDLPVINVRYQPRPSWSRSTTPTLPSFIAPKSAIVNSVWSLRSIQAYPQTGTR
jgi:hypothetical protein